jgi:lysyl-tRNA synthetase, class II
MKASETERRAKLERLREDGIDPYPRSFTDRTAIGEIKERHDPEEMAEGEYEEIPYRLAGRLCSRRNHGKTMFLDLLDISGRIEVYARREDFGEEAFRRFKELNVGDMVGIDGILAVTRRQLLAINAKQAVLLAKALRDPPDFVHGLGDRETRYRRRELDMMVSAESRQVFLTRSKLLATIRAEMGRRGFVELETPILQTLFGGATARPFETHHNALNRNLYLRTATELYLKRAVIGGFENVFELGRIFRNEGISTEHNPEFTMLELMVSGADYRQAMDFSEELVSDLVRGVTGTTEVEYRGRTIDFAPPWRRLSLREALLDAVELDVTTCDNAEMAERLGGDLDAATDRIVLVDKLRQRFIEPKLQQPTFLMELPVRHWPANRAMEEDPEMGEVFDVIAGGMEIYSGGTEINDPSEQRSRFVDQRTLSDPDGDIEPHPYDEEFLQALEHGLPPVAGCGLGVDRLMTILTDSGSLRDVVLFPTMRKL